MTTPDPKRNKRILLWVLLGLGVPTVAIIGFAVYWLYFAASPVPLGVVVQPNDKGFLAFHSAADDPGMNAVMTRMFERANETQRTQGRFGELLAKLNSFNTSRGLRDVWPKSASMSFDADGPVGVVNIDSRVALSAAKYMLPNLAKDSGGKPIGYQGREMIPFGSAMVTIDGVSVMFATNRASMERLIDRIDKGEAEPPLPAEFAELSQRVSTGTDLHGVVLDRKVIEQWVSTFGGNASEFGIERVAGAMDLVDADKGQATLVFVAGSPAAAGQVKEWIEPFIELMLEGFRMQGLVAKVTSTIEQRDLTLRVDFSNHLAMLDKLMSGVPSQMEAPTDPSEEIDLEGLE